jgi:hypothetical protein
MKNVCSPINKPRPVSSPKLIKVSHAPVYGPPATGGGNAPRASLTANVTVRTGGRDLSNPDPFSGPDRAA